MTMPLNLGGLEQQDGKANKLPDGLQIAQVHEFGISLSGTFRAHSWGIVCANVP